MDNYTEFQLKISHSSSSLRFTFQTVYPVIILKLYFFYKHFMGFLGLTSFRHKNSAKTRQRKLSKIAGIHPQSKQLYELRVSK
jgi:hypothetical protein